MKDLESLMAVDERILGDGRGTRRQWFTVLIVRTKPE